MQNLVFLQTNPQASSCMLRNKTMFHIPHIYALLTLLLAAAHAALTPELYWNSVLPHTKMPKAVRDLLQPEIMDYKSVSVLIDKNGVNVHEGKGKPGGTTANIRKQGVNVNTGNEKPGEGTNVKAEGKGVHVNTGKSGETNVSIARGTNFMYAIEENQHKEGQNVALYFLEKELHAGKTMNVQFKENSNKVPFLPRQVADTIPFSSGKLSEIFDKFSVKPGSLEAQIIRKTIKECETPGIKGEEKYCATSLESMIDFSTSKLGKQVQAISTEAYNQTQMKSYTVQEVKEMTGDKSVVCHKQNYAYAIFYCHETQTTRAYFVSLKATGTTEVKAVAICHTDTSAWNPKHLAFQELKLKPGTVPVCHFLPQDHIIWVPN